MKLYNTGRKHLRVIDIPLSPDYGEIKIIPFADWHKDDARCNPEYIEHTVKLIRDGGDNVYGIANGDLINMALKSSVSSIYEQRMNPQEQLEWVIETLRPIKDKLLCYNDGNHDLRLFKDAGIIPGRYVCSALGIGERYGDTGALLFLSFGVSERRRSEGRMMTYSVYCKHGSGGGKKEGGKVNALVDFADNVDSDIYVMGHVHMPFQTALQYYRVNISQRSVNPVNKLFLSTSAALEFGGYGETGGFRPAAIADMCITLDGHRRRMKAEMSV